jgi:hypothetical protein
MSRSRLSASSGGRLRDTPVPEKLIVGYASWNQCDDKLVEAVKQGVNVLIWFAVNLAADPETGKPVITSGPDLECVKEKIAEIDALGLPTVHLISIGGWNAPHPNTSVPVEDMYAAWKEWNNGLFDGFDWDIEGNDDMNSVYNHFTYECLDFMGKFSQMAKQDGYIVSMAPAESYIDVTTSAFDLDLNHTYPEWMTLQPNFEYHGRNVYAYLLEYYGETMVETRKTGEKEDEEGLKEEDTQVKEEQGEDVELVPCKTFDWVMIQLYEGFSHAEYNTTILGQSPVDYLMQYMQRIYNGWHIEFGEDVAKRFDRNTRGESPPPAASFLNIPNTELVIGLANGWAGDGKFLLIYPEDVGSAYNQMAAMGMAPRGFGFWDIKDEGEVSTQNPDKGPVWMAQGLNEFMKVR